ncbi:MAG: hypothetical protein R3D00_20800 [Bacteroidia bacterium]
MKTQTQTLAWTIIMAIFLPMSFSGCIVFYKKKSIQESDLGKIPYQEIPDWESFIISNQQNTRPYTLAHTPEGVYYLSILGYEEDYINLKTEKVNYPFYFPESNVFRRKNIPKQYRSEFLHATNLYVNQGMDEESVILPIGHIDSARIYFPATGLNIYVNAALGVVSFVTASVIVLAIACNCPQVYTLSPDGIQTSQGSLFTGAISKSLERTDFLPLHDLNRSGPNIEITVANELPEEEFINQVSLLRTKRIPNTEFAINTDDQLVAYSQPHTPVSAISLNGKNLLPLVSAADTSHFDFSDFPMGSQLNTATFSFSKSDFPNGQPLLVINARQTEWLESIAEVFFNAFGDQFDRWNTMMDKVPREKYEARTAERGLSMNVFIETDNGWQKAGTFHNAGVNKQKRMGLPLDLSQVSGEMVNIRLECAYKFWEIDEIGIADNWAEITDFEEVPLVSAINEKGEDVSGLIKSIDQQYALQPDAGSAITLTFPNTASAEEIYVLRGTGYYHHIRNYENKPDKAFIRYMRAHQKTVTQELSVLLNQIQQNQALTSTKP